MRFIVFGRLERNDSLIVYIKLSTIKKLEEVCTNFILFLQSIDRWKLRKDVTTIFLYHVLISNSIIEDIWVNCPQLQHPLSFYLPMQASNGRI